MILTEDQKNTIRAFSVHGLIKEACGFILDDGRVLRTPNVHADPGEAFQIDPEAYAAASELGIRAIWHSHAELDGFSPADQAAVLADGEEPWVVYCLRTDAFHVVDPADHGPLIGRTFCYGILDCYSLVCDALEERHGIQLPTWRRGNWGEWGRPDFTAFDDQVAEHCRQLGNERILPGDIVFFGRRQTSHIGVFTASDRFLHHQADGRSEEAHYNEWWLARTRGIWRPAGCQPTWAAVG